MSAWSAYTAPGASSASSIPHRSGGFVTAVVPEPGEVLAVPVERLRGLRPGTGLGDLILRAFLIRRSMLIGLGAGFRIVGSSLLAGQPATAPVRGP